MNDTFFADLPPEYNNILQASKDIDFNMPSDLQTGSLLKTLSASKPSARILELGTGTGLATSWILAGMDKQSELVTIENNEDLLRIAKMYLKDERIRFVNEDGYSWLLSNQELPFDVVFADAMPGKYELFDEAWSLVKTAGFYIIDDMLPQPNWPDGHAEKVFDFIAKLESRQDTVLTKLNWSTGIIIATKRHTGN